MSVALKRTDSALQQAVLQELKWDTRVEETEVGVEVDSGIVTLTGTVGSWAKRQAAQAAAHRVYGVLDVANDIIVKLPGTGVRNDTDVAKAVRRALDWNVLVPATRISSTVTDGWVTLEGSVEYGAQRDDAESAIRNLVGVRGVSNNIIVTPPKLDPQEIRRSIESALERQADREARRIKIELHDGKVNLAGTVHSTPERDAILGAVRGTPGVRTVDSHLVIDPFKL